MNLDAMVESKAAEETGTARELLSKLDRDERGGSVVEKILITLIALGGIVALASVINFATSEVKDDVESAFRTTQDTSQISPGG